MLVRASLVFSWLMAGLPAWAQAVPGAAAPAPPPAAVSTSADALSIGGRVVLGGFGRFGFTEGDGVVPTKLKVGLAAVVDKPLAPAFSLGGSFELHSWGLRGNGDSTGRDVLIDLMVRPRVRTVYDETLEFAVVLPIGGFLSAISEENWGESDIAPGWSFGVRPQVRVHLDGVIVEVEAGWHRRAVTHDVAFFSLDAFTNEVVLSAGVSVPL